MEYVTRERIAIEITISNGTPQELSLEVLFGSVSSTYVFGTDTEITDEGSGVYRYTFVPADDKSGLYRYRWYGKDSTGVEFAIPENGTGYTPFRVNHKP